MKFSAKAAVIAVAASLLVSLPCVETMAQRRVSSNKFGGGSRQQTQSPLNRSSFSLRSKPSFQNGSHIPPKNSGRMQSGTRNGTQQFQKQKNVKFGSKTQSGISPRPTIPKGASSNSKLNQRPAGNMGSRIPTSQVPANGKFTGKNPTRPNTSLTRPGIKFPTQRPNAATRPTGKSPIRPSAPTPRPNGKFPSRPTKLPGINQPTANRPTGNNSSIKKPIIGLPSGTAGTVTKFPTKPGFKPFPKPLPKPLPQPLPKPPIVIVPKPPVVIVPNPPICIPAKDWCNYKPTCCHWWWNHCPTIRYCQMTACVSYSCNVVTCDFATGNGAVVEDVRWWLGLTGMELPQKGLGIETIAENSPAANAGLQPGMIIIECNGIEIVDGQSFSQAIDQSGGVLNLKILNEADGEVGEVSIQMKQLSVTKF